MADDQAGSAATLLVVAAALIDPSGRVLVQQRPSSGDHAGRWEFPGGKVDPGEALRAALARELTEELGVGVEAGSLDPLGFATGRAAGRELVLLLFGCRSWAGEPRALYATAIDWIAAEQLGELPMPPVDVALLPDLVAYVQCSQAKVQRCGTKDT